MKLINHTPNDAYYGISDASSTGCGSLKANAQIDLPALDNKQNVKVSFSALGKGPAGDNPFSVTIPKTRKGTAVTIGLYQA